LPENKLLDRCEVWADEVPDGVGVLTAGVDFQYDRCEIEVVGWGRLKNLGLLLMKPFMAT
jgi:phage terminase large subunit GpA-like protein